MKVTVTMIVTAKMVLFVAEIIVLLEVEVIFSPELIVAQPQQVKIFASDGAMWICENLNNLWLDTQHFTEYSITCLKVHLISGNDISSQNGNDCDCMVGGDSCTQDKSKCPFDYSKFNLNLILVMNSQFLKA